MDVTTFGAGCFWKPEFLLGKINGVLKTRVGYMGGSTKNPTYEQVCTGQTGHAEVVQINYDPKLLNYESLLDYFWEMHDPTQLDRQGLDVGSQYRSIIFCHSKDQEEKASTSLLKIQESGNYLRKIVTVITTDQTFWPAEDYHQKYYEKNHRY
ncbi:MAG: peptide-methionine (S)-S-oxide reductase [Gammaproteobacteria bacterium]|jgi:peptide-methionine (S)-S-oxide reductase|nr:peptide-methionine (S)-S-oxide reductase [Gammaproteobacteria bacterium]|tara:strand:- start:417 stop:875 length:459 start_codon:yes stop_codon:yes gene_type:complete